MVSDGERCCHDPSTTRPDTHKTECRKKPGRSGRDDNKENGGEKAAGLRGLRPSLQDAQRKGHPLFFVCVAAKGVTGEFCGCAAGKGVSSGSRFERLNVARF